MQFVLASQWAERIKGDGITVHSMHPGWSATPGVSDSLPGFATVMGPLLRDADEGADTVVWLASAPEGTRETGLFWHDRAPRPAHYFPCTTSRALRNPQPSARVCGLSARKRPPEHDRELVVKTQQL